MTVPIQQNAGSRVTTGRTGRVSHSTDHHDGFCIRLWTSSERLSFALLLERTQYYSLKHECEGEATVKFVLKHIYIIAHLHDRLIESDQCVPEHLIMRSGIFSRCPLHFPMISQVQRGPEQDMLTLHIDQLCPSLDLSL